MNRGLYISATSLVANQKRLDVLANNLANVNTTGYKKDISLMETFPEKLLSRINDKRPKIRGIGENEIDYEQDGDVHRARTQKGYFVVRTPYGEKSYVKEIQFTIDDDGYLKTYYRDDRGEYKTDYENYIIDRTGNRVQGTGNLEALLEQIVYFPPSHVIGTMNAGVNFKRIVTDYSPGELIETGGTFDLALLGDGFFQIQGEDGTTYYTRDGSFVVNEDGYLSTLRGELVIGTNGPIAIDGEDVEIDGNGVVRVDGDDVGTINVVNIGNKEFLRKIGDNLYRMALDKNGEEIPAEEEPFEGQVLQGFLEGSNVNAISEMVEMITLLRDFEASQRAVRAQDEMLEKVSNEIGRV